MKKIIFMFFICLVISGCAGTSVYTSEHSTPDKYYEATTKDLYFLACFFDCDLETCWACPIMMPAAAIDLPFALIADTVAIPTIKKNKQEKSQGPPALAEQEHNQSLKRDGEPAVVSE